MVSFDSGVSGPRCLHACPVQPRDAGARGLGCGLCLARVWVFGRFLLSGEVGGLCWAPVSTVVNSTYRGSEGWLYLLYPPCLPVSAFARNVNVSVEVGDQAGVEVGTG